MSRWTLDWIGPCAAGGSSLTPLASWIQYLPSA